MKENRLFKSDKLKMFLVGIFVVVGFSAVVMVLWNLLIPELLGLKMISFWQAVGLFILSRILFSSFWGGGKPHDRRMGPFGDNPIHEKWMKMTDKEREDFINRRREFLHNGLFDRNDFFGMGYERTGNEERIQDDKQ